MDVPVNGVYMLEVVSEEFVAYFEPIFFWPVEATVGVFFAPFCWLLANYYAYGVDASFAVAFWIAGFLITFTS